MQFKICTSEEADSQLLSFIDNHPHSGIWHYPRWITFQKKVNSCREGFLFYILNEDQVVLSGCLLLKRVKKIFNYGYIPGGILYGELTRELYNFLCTELARVAAREKLVFIQADSIVPFSKEFAALVESRKDHRKDQKLPIPGYTNLIRLENSEDDILKAMKSKGRYNIRLAAKKGVVIKEGTTADIPRYYEILRETTRRDKFAGHSASYYKHFLETIDSAKLLLAYHEDMIIAGGIFTFTKQQALYYYGASSNTKRNLMAPYLVQWEAIKEGKARDCAIFDFMGIADPDNPSDPLGGVTDFKLKFGGDVVRFNPAYHMVFKPAAYFLFNLLKKAVRIFR